MNIIITLLFFAAVAALYARCFKQWGDCFLARWASQFLLMLGIWAVLHLIIKYW